MFLKLLLTEEQIREAVTSGAKHLYSIVGDCECTFLVVLDGAFMFAADFLRAFASYRSASRKMFIEFVEMKSYVGKGSSGKVQILMEPKELTGTVVVLEDIVDTGLTMTELCRYLREQREVKDIITVTFLDKPSARKIEFAPDVVCFSLEGKPFVVGYGLDYNGHFRELAEVYELIE